MTKTPDQIETLLSQYILHDSMAICPDLEKSKGNHIFDRKSNRLLLDCYSYFASHPVGHNHPKLDDPAFEKALLMAAKAKPANSDVWTEPMANFVEVFARVAKPRNMDHLFLIEGGGAAVENAMKTAFDWKIRLNFSKGAKEERGTKILHFHQAFHGRLGYTMSATNTADPRKTKYFPKFEWPRISNPKITFPLNDANLAAVKAAEARAEEEIHAAFRTYGDDIAAIIIETIQGEGGDNHFRPEFHATLRRLADHYEVLFIYDEVQTGIGLTGKMWAYEHYGTQADIVCFGKKMQVCGFVAGPKIDQVKDNVFVEASRINSTWGGNLVDMVRAQRYLEIIEEEKLVANAASMGTVVLNALHDLQNQYPNLVSNSRGLGLMCAFTLRDADIRDKFHRKAAEQGVLVLKSGSDSLRLRPALTFSKDNVDELMDVLKRTAATF